VLSVEGVLKANVEETVKPSVGAKEETLLSVSAGAIGKWRRKDCDGGEKSTPAPLRCHRPEKGGTIHHRSWRRPKRTTKKSPQVERHQREQFP